MRIVLVGSSGMLGSRVLGHCAGCGHEVTAPSLDELDLERRESVDAYFRGRGFDALVNCAAYTAVDACEDAVEREKAFRLNATAPGWLAGWCRDAGARMVHLSTDYVFDGSKDGPYEETDVPDPVNAYGRTKWAGERSVQEAGGDPLIVRTAWLYGPNGRHFVGTIAGLMRERDVLQVVDDQTGAPTFTGDLAVFLEELLLRKAPRGIYHFTNEGSTTWFGFACRVRELLGLDACRLEPVDSGRFPRPARRPANSRLSLEKSMRTVGHRFRPWQEALREYLSLERP